MELQSLGFGRLGHLTFLTFLNLARKRTYENWMKYI